jgi:hypothetical protein
VNTTIELTNIGSSNNQNISFFEKIPKELKIEILKYLPLNNCSYCVSKEFKEINLNCIIIKANNMEFALDKIGLGNLEKAIEFLENNKELDSFNFTETEIDVCQLNEICKKRPTLKNLSFKINSALSNKVTNDLSNFTGISQLHILNVNAYKESMLNLCKLNNLKSLEITIKETSQLEELNKISSLTSISLHFFVNQSLGEYLDIINTEKFSSLNLYYKYLMGEIPGVEHLEKINNLHSLHFEECDVYANRFSNLQQIRRLSLEYCDIIDDKTLGSLEALKNLQVIRFETKYPKKSFDTLSKLKQLKELIFDQCDNITEEQTLLIQENLNNTKVSFFPCDDSIFM